MATAVSAPARDQRSVRIQEELLRAHWKDVVKKRPPAERLRWVESQEGITALGAKMAGELAKAIRALVDSTRDDVCGDDWLEAFEHRGEKFPPGGVKGTAMVRSRVATSYGLNVANEPDRLLTRGHRRWTPPQAVTTEDAMDGMTANEAMLYRHPPSPSAIAIFVLTHYHPDAKRRLATPAGARSKALQRQRSVDEARADAARENAAR